MFRKLPCIILLFLSAGFVSAQYKVRLEIKEFPSYQSSGTSLFLAGSMNEWNPGNKDFQFQQTDKGTFFLDLKLDKGSYQYKITRGDWNRAECTKEGLDIANRELYISSDTGILVTIEGWKDHFHSEPIKIESTADKNVHILNDSFRIPQLHVKRRIWIYLPEGYATSKTRYPVMYLQDGQNIFDNVTSYSGEWGVDECLDTMKKKCIIVAIDNGGGKRLNEYCPYDFSLTGIAAGNVTGKGEGKQYVKFLVKTLKPFIDKKYRTFRDKSHTFIAGSSMGGLISMYALLKYPKVFGGAGVFSPAFWVGPEIFTDIKKMGKKVHSKIYFYAGKKEGATMVPDMLKAMEEMNKVSNAKMTTVIRDNGKHNEQAWRKEFPLFYRWIMN